MDIFMLYLWTRLDSIIALAVIATIIIGVVLIFASVNWLSDEDSGYESRKDTALAWKRAAIRAAKYLTIPVFVLLLIPTQKDAAIIAGGWAAKKIATSDAAQQLSSKTLALINGKLDEELAKLSPTTKE